MGLCSSCLKGDAAEVLVSPDVEIRRKQMLEAAEKRRVENESRGIKDLDKVKRQQQRDAERERIESEMAKAGSGNTNLKWQAN